MQITARAPGKIVLLGEYAVLEGAPALVMAVDRYAKITLATHNESYSQVESPNWGNGPARFTLEQQQMIWQDSATADSYSLISHIITALLKATDTQVALPNFNLSIDTADFFQSRQTKLGLGSSAAITVSLAGALLKLIGVEKTNEELLPQLIDAHRSFQGGRGSGIDIASSLYGGLIAYQTDSRHVSPTVQQYTLPSGLYYMCIFTGKSASTTNFIGRYNDWKTQDPQGSTNLIDCLKNIVIHSQEIVHYGDSSRLLQAVKDYAQQLKELTKASGLPIYSAEHLHIDELARAAGVSYKPCGAGGGDIGLALSDDPQRLTELKQKLLVEGLQLPEIGIANTGLELSVTME